MLAGAADRCNAKSQLLGNTASVSWVGMQKPRTYSRMSDDPEAKEGSREGPEAVPLGPKKSKLPQYEVTWNPLRRLERLYPVECCGHGYHWTELVLCFFVASALTLLLITLAVAALPSFLFCLLTSGVSGLSFVFIWGIASIKSLAGIATDLEKRQLQLEQARKVMEQNSKNLHAAVNGIKGEITQFASGLGLLEDNLDGLEKVEAGLQELTDHIEANQSIERELGKHEQHFAKAQREYLMEKEKEVFKDQFVKGGLFDMATEDGLIDSPEEFKGLWEVLESDPFLKSLDEKRIDWRSPIRQIQASGSISLWQLLDAFDVATNSHFLRIRHADRETDDLERQLGEVEDQLDKLNNRRRFLPF